MNVEAESGTQKAGKKILDLVLKYSVPPLFILFGAVLAFAVMASSAVETDKNVGEFAVSYWEILAHGKPATLEETDPTQIFEIGPITTNLRDTAKARFIQIGISLETRKSTLADVQQMKGDIEEALILFLRGLDGRDLQGSHAAARFKSQVERRVALVDEQGKISRLAIHHLVLQ
ncbi:FliL protein [Tepidicaulis marinus]|uniref:Flagellar protein FliL n=1 Tax=Tepidicaulis marinus TaxID=1333998 RepID=A0A081BB39_9HYPH|nr:flagellar basal body-associated FliL family protein [Tepidicaulis marinus]GAK45257.1 FliL protein [Tepidicaulis marinus]